MRSPHRFAVLVLVLASGLASLAAAPSTWAQAGSRSDALRERIKTRPDDPTLYYYLALFEIEEGDHAAAVAALRDVARLGRGFLPPRGGEFEPLWSDTAYQSVRAELEQQLPKVTTARELFRLDRGLVPEGIAYDPQTRRYYVGSIATGKIVSVDSSGAVSDFAPTALRQPLLGLAVDAGRRRLHAVRTTGFLDAAPLRPPVNEILSFDLNSGARVRAVAIPGAVQLNDVAVAANGDLYASDTQGGSVFHVRDADGAVDTVAAGALPGANGLALSADGTVLYVAHSTGVARIRLADKSVLARIEIPRGETIAAVDGLYTDGATLIGIQNVTNPGRVIRMRLKPGGDAVEKMETLLSHHHPAIDEPTTGVVVGRTFVLLATTQVARYTPQGTITSPETMKAPIVLSIDLGGSS
jgi:sugar lactone lactonase YvrE